MNYQSAIRIFTKPNFSVTPYRAPRRFFAETQAVGQQQTQQKTQEQVQASEQQKSGEEKSTAVEVHERPSRAIRRRRRPNEMEFFDTDLDFPVLGTSVLTDLGFPSLSNMMRDFDRLGRVFDVQTSRLDRELEWAPRADIIEDTKEFVVEAEIPGVPKENIKINVEDDVLTLSGEKTSEREFKQRGRVRRERTWGTFERRFVLPDNVDAKNIKANYDHGVLKVVIPKLEVQEGTKIDVKID